MTSKPRERKRLQLDAQRLDRLGYRGLTSAQVNELLDELYNAGEEIVGFKLAGLMSNQHLDEFEVFVDADDSDAAFKWLESNFPNYREIVEETFEYLDGVLRDAAIDPKQLAHEGSSLPEVEQADSQAAGGPS